MVITKKFTNVSTKLRNFWEDLSTTDEVVEEIMEANKLWNKTMYGYVDFVKGLNPEEEPTAEDYAITEDENIVELLKPFYEGLQEMLSEYDLDGIILKGVVPIKEKDSFCIAYVFEDVITSTKVYVWYNTEDDILNSTDNYDTMKMEIIEKEYFVN